MNPTTICLSAIRSAPAMKKDVVFSASVVRLLAFLALALSCTSLVFGQTGRTPEDEERSGRLLRMTQSAQKITVSCVVDSNRIPARLVSSPVLRMSDMSRERLDGTIWLWTHRARPVVILQLWTQIHHETLYEYAFSSLSTGLVVAKSEYWTWAPDRGGLKWVSIPGTGPSEKPVMRLRQMKDLARRFTSQEYWDPNNQRTELRLLPQPIHRYAAAEDVTPEDGVVDGAVFAFCQDTDPEVILLIESVRQQGTAVHWQYGLAPLGSAEFHVQFDGQTVWRLPRAPGISGNPTDPYRMLTAPAPRPTDPAKEQEGTRY
ncbi:MAG: hypothetical protein ACLQNE_32980 [Thermoguttaceae bacterium]